MKKKLKNTAKYIDVLNDNDYHYRIEYHLQNSVSVLEL